MSKWVFLNNAFVPADTACLPVADLAIQRGYGIFDFIKVVRDTPIFINEHLQRFYRSAAAMHLPVPYCHAELTAIIQELVSRNSLALSGVRITLTGGNSADGYSITTPNVVITQNSFSLPSDDAIAKGLYLVTKEHQRQLAHVKTIDYLIPIWLQPEIKNVGADDVLYTDNGIVSECPRANIFMVTKDNVLLTPSAAILHGITRSKVLELATQICTVEEKALSLAEVYDAREVFINSTTKGILPVSRIDHVEYNSPQPITTQLSEQLTVLYSDYQGTAKAK